jgi:hypothetical protein
MIFLRSENGPKNTSPALFQYLCQNTQGFLGHCESARGRESPTVTGWALWTRELCLRVQSRVLVPGAQLPSGKWISAQWDTLENADVLADAAGVVSDTEDNGTGNLRITNVKADSPAFVGMRRSALS